MKLTRDYVVHTRTGIGHCFLGPQNACGRLRYDNLHLQAISVCCARQLVKEGRFCQRCQRALARDDRIMSMEQRARDGKGDRS